MPKEGLSPFDQLRKGLKYYLLDYKNKNIVEFNREHQGKGLRDLTDKELFLLFGKATSSDTITLVKKL